MRCLRKISRAVDRGLTSFYRHLGRFTARRPWVVIAITGVITLACCAGFMRFEVEQDAEKLYTPQDAPSFVDKDYVDNYYPSDSFSVKILSLDKAENGANVLLRAYLLEHLRALRTITSQVLQSRGRSYTWQQVCEKETAGSANCRIDSVLRFWNFSEAAIAADPTPLATLNDRTVVDHLGQPINLNWVLGGLRRNPLTGNVTSAEVLQTVLYIRAIGGDGEDSPAFKWQERITQVAYDDWQSPLMAQYVSCDAAVGRESTEAIDRDVQRLTVGYILLVVYTIVVLWRNSWAFQKAHIALASFLAIGMGIAADFGMLSGLGVRFNFVCQVLPFLLVGVGVDSTFVIVSNYFDQDPDAPLEHRIGEALGLAGSSVTVSCLTNVIAFAVGTYTSLEALYSFSIYASIGTLLVFIFQVTVFPAFLVLEARRELRTRLGTGCPCFGCVAPGCCADPAAEQIKHGNNGWALANNVYKHDHLGPQVNNSNNRQPPSTMPSSSLESGSLKRGSAAALPPQPPGINGGPSPSLKVAVRPPSPERMVANPQAAASEVDLKRATRTGSGLSTGGGGNASPTAWGPARDFTTPTIFSCFCLGKVFNPHDDQLSTKLIARWLPAVSLTIYGKIVVLILEGLMLGFAIYGCTQVYMDFNFRELFVPEGNWLHEAFQVEDRYFGGEKVPVAIYTRETSDGRDYYYYQDQLVRLSTQFSANPYITSVPPVSSWYVDYQRWLLNNATVAPQLVQGRAPNETAFYNWLTQWLSTAGRPFANDILFNVTSGRIIGSRLTGFTNDVVDGSWAVKCVDSLRATAAAAAPNLNPIAFGFSFTFWDGFRTIATSTVINVVMAAAAVFLVTLILLADIQASLMVGLMVVLCDVGVFGFMHYANLQFNSVTCIVLVLAVGIAVDYSAHVMRAFLVSTGTRQERAHKALIEIGGAVWNGAVTTFLAVLPMAAAEHYIFTTIFKMFGVLVLLSIWHGVVLLPVLMSWVGPRSYRDLDEPATQVHAV